jgi:hypothetical protein
MVPFTARSSPEGLSSSPRSRQAPSSSHEQRQPSSLTSPVLGHPVSSSPGSGHSVPDSSALQGRATRIEDCEESKGRKAAEKVLQKFGIGKTAPERPRSRTEGDETPPAMSWALSELGAATSSQAGADFQQFMRESNPEVADEIQQTARLFPPATRDAVVEALQLPWRFACEGSLEALRPLNRLVQALAEVSIDRQVFGENMLAISRPGELSKIFSDDPAMSAAPKEVRSLIGALLAHLLCCLEPYPNHALFKVIRHELEQFERGLVHELPFRLSTSCPVALSLLEGSKLIALQGSDLDGRIWPPADRLKRMLSLVGAEALSAQFRWVSSALHRRGFFSRSSTRPTRFGLDQPNGVLQALHLADQYAQPFEWADGPAIEAGRLSNRIAALCICLIETRDQKNPKTPVTSLREILRFSQVLSYCEHNHELDEQVNENPDGLLYRRIAQWSLDRSADLRAGIKDIWICSWMEQASSACPRRMTLCRDLIEAALALRFEEESTRLPFNSVAKFIEAFELFESIFSKDVRAKLTTNGLIEYPKVNRANRWKNLVETAKASWHPEWSSQEIRSGLAAVLKARPELINSCMLWEVLALCAGVERPQTAQFCEGANGAIWQQRVQERFVHQRTAGNAILQRLFGAPPSDIQEDGSTFRAVSHRQALEDLERDGQLSGDVLSPKACESAIRRLLIGACMDQKSKDPITLANALWGLLDENIFEVSPARHAKLRLRALWPISAGLVHRTLPLEDSTTPSNGAQQSRRLVTYSLMRAFWTVAPALRDLISELRKKLLSKYFDKLQSKTAISEDELVFVLMFELQDVEIQQLEKFINTEAVKFLRKLPKLVQTMQFPEAANLQTKYPKLDRMRKTYCSSVQQDCLLSNATRLLSRMRQPNRNPAVFVQDESVSQLPWNLGRLTHGEGVLEVGENQLRTASDSPSNPSAGGLESFEERSIPIRGSRGDAWQFKRERNGSLICEGVTTAEGWEYVGDAAAPVASEVLRDGMKIAFRDHWNGELKLPSGRVFRGEFEGKDPTEQGEGHRENGILIPELRVLWKGARDLTAQELEYFSRHLSESKGTTIKEGGLVEALNSWSGSRRWLDMLQASIDHAVLICLELKARGLIPTPPKQVNERIVRYLKENAEGLARLKSPQGVLEASYRWLWQEGLPMTWPEIALLLESSDGSPHDLMQAESARWSKEEWEHLLDSCGLAATLRIVTGPLLGSLKHPSQPAAKALGQICAQVPEALVNYREGGVLHPALQALWWHGLPMTSEEVFELLYNRDLRHRLRERDVAIWPQLVDQWTDSMWSRVVLEMGLSGVLAVLNEVDDPSRWRSLSLVAKRGLSFARQERSKRVLLVSRSSEMIQEPRSSGSSQSSKEAPERGGLDPAASSQELQRGSGARRVLISSAAQANLTQLDEGEQLAVARWMENAAIGWFGRKRPTTLEAGGTKWLHSHIGTASGALLIIGFKEQPAAQGSAGALDCQIGWILRGHRYDRLESHLPDEQEVLTPLSMEQIQQMASESRRRIIAAPTSQHASTSAAEPDAAQSPPGSGRFQTGRCEELAQLRAALAGYQLPRFGPLQGDEMRVLNDWRVRFGLTPESGDSENTFLHASGELVALGREPLRELATLLGAQDVADDLQPDREEDQAAFLRHLTPLWDQAMERLGPQEAELNVYELIASLAAQRQ